MADFVIPDFLQNCDVDTIHQEMLDMLPDTIDKSEGGFVWDFTRPTALIVSELLEFRLVETIKTMFAQYSYGVYLDSLAAQAQVTRKPAVCATAELTVSGIPATVIPAGMVFATAEDGSVPSVEFKADQESVIGSGGSVSVSVTAVNAGTSGNVGAGTIVLMSSPITGVTSVTNPSAASGGTEEEDDEALRQRVLDAYAGTDQSFTGCDGDYKRWAESVDGIGKALVIPEWNGAGTVKLVCSDSNGEAASPSLCAAVYNHIMRPDDPFERLAPTCVSLTVVAPTTISMTYTFTAELADDYTVSQAEEAFTQALKEYYKTVVEDGAIRYSRVSSLISSLECIKDFKLLKINGGTANVPIATDEYPETTSVTVTEGDV